MDTSEVFALFETINSKLDKQPNKPIESIQVDLSAISTMTKRFENLIEEVRMPTKIEYHHFYKIDIRSKWFFLSGVALLLYLVCFG
jgi:hypothetical protein